jgi:RNA polymerase sigma factor (sigma-70 family)
MTEFSDLLWRARAGDIDACADLWQRVEPAVRTTIRRRLSSALRRRFDSVDLAQSVFGDYVRSLVRFEDRGEDAFRHWLQIKAESKVLQKLRSLLRPDGTLKESPLLGPEPRDGQRSPSSTASAEEARDEIGRALGHLDDLSRTVVHLKVVEGLEFAAIASLLDLPSADAARKRHARALVALRGSLRDLAPRTRSVS